MAPVPGSGKNMHKSLVIVFPEAVLYNLVKCKKVHLLIRVFRKGESSKLKTGAWGGGLEGPLVTGSLSNSSNDSHYSFVMYYKTSWVFALSAPTGRLFQNFSKKPYFRSKPPQSLFFFFFNTIVITEASSFWC